ncbi:MAG: peptidylprolyl isomerase [Planctomycetota bacterium]|nr:peptidylprolyl isomerase [Planctomycetota bacterium]
MLGFFRKYEKTFFLVVFAPAVLSLGISGVMVASIQNAARDSQDYKVFFEKVDEDDIGGGVITNPDDTLTKYAWEKKADQAKIMVSDAEVADAIAKTVNQDQQVLQRKVEELMTSRGLKKGTPEWNKSYFTTYFEVRGSTELSQKDYDKFLADRKTKAPDFEKRVRNQLRFSRLTNTASDLAYITPEQLYASYQEQHHSRVLEAIMVEGKDHMPNKDNLDMKKVESFFKANLKQYLVHPQAKVHVLMYPYADAKKGIKTATAAEMKAFYDANPGFYNDATGKQKDFKAVSAQIKSDIFNERLQMKVLKSLDGAHSLLTASNQVADMAVIHSSTPTLIHKVTDLMNVKDLQAKHKDLAGEPLEIWFNNLIVHRPSSPLLGEKAGFIFWLRDVKPLTYPKFKDVQAKVVKDYLYSPVFDMNVHFNKNKTKFRTEEKFKVETLVVSYERLAALIKDKSIEEGELTDWFDSHKDDYKGKKFPEVRKDVLQALKLSKAKEQIDETFDALSKKIKALTKKGQSVDLEGFDSDPEIPHYRAMEIKERELTRKELADDKILEGFTTQVTATNNVKKVSAVQSLADDSGKFLYYVDEVLKSEIPKFEDVKEDVRQDLLKERGFKLAKEYASKLYKELEGLTGERLTKLLKDRKIKTKTFEPVKKSDTELEGIKNASGYISDLFSFKPEGPFTKKQENTEKLRVDLLRCASRQDAPADEFSAKRDELRKNKLREARGKISNRWTRKLIQSARSIEGKHIEYARDLYTGGKDQKITSIEIRQLAFKPDPKTIEIELVAAAKEKMKEAALALREGIEFGKVALAHSEDIGTRTIDGDLGEKRRGDLTVMYGPTFEEAVYQLSRQGAGKISDLLVSKLGVHIVRIDEVGLPMGAIRISHIMKKTSPKFRKLSAATLEKAKAITKKKVVALYKRLQTESFARVLQDQKDNDAISYEKGVPLKLDYMSPFQIAVSGININEYPRAIEHDGAFHTILASDDSGRSAGQGEDARNYRYLSLTHASFDKAEKAEKLRQELIKFQQNYENQGEKSEAPWGEVTRKLKELARKRSNAPTKLKGGVLGTYKVDRRILPYGKAWMTKVFALAAQDKGSPRIALIEDTDYGYHIVEIVEVTEVKTTDIDPHAQFELSVIRNCDWK